MSIRVDLMHRHSKGGAHGRDALTLDFGLIGFACAESDFFFCLSSHLCNFCCLANFSLLLTADFLLWCSWSCCRCCRIYGGCFRAWSFRAASEQFTNARPSTGVRGCTCKRSRVVAASGIVGAVVMMMVAQTVDETFACSSQAGVAGL